MGISFLELFFKKMKRGYESQWSAIVSISSKIGCTAETLRLWFRRFEIDQGQRGDITSDDRARIKERERENRELRRAKEILRKESAFSPGGARPSTEVTVSFRDVHQGIYGIESIYTLLPITL